MDLIVAFPGGLAAGILFCRLFFNGHFRRGKLLTAENNSLKALLSEKEIAYASHLAKLEAELSYKEEKLQVQKQEIENIGARFEAQFKVLASSVLEEKSARFNIQQEQHLKAVLEPLKEHIHHFRRDFEARQNKESEERISLREQIRQMMFLNQNLSEQADNLTRALRGNVKQQGNWGEMILESMLQYTGLQKGIHYFVQEQSQNGEGQTIRPDVIVRYPDERAIVIDSKVSMVHYESFCSATDTSSQEAFLKAMVQSVKNHINGLSAKSYQDVTTSLDFVLMFVPVEAAYISVMQHDRSLWKFAYDRKILLISPSNLITAMKLVADMWQRDNIDREAQKIAERAGKLYDKLVLFVENFEKVGYHISKAEEVWREAYGQLSKGKNNAVFQAEKMKLFSRKTGKSLPQKLVEESLLENGEEREEALV